MEGVQHSKLHAYFSAGGDNQHTGVGDSIPITTTIVTNYTPTADTVRGHMEGVDTILGALPGGTNYTPASASFGGHLSGINTLFGDVAGFVAPSNYTPAAATVRGHLEGIDTALGGGGGGTLGAAYTAGATITLTAAKPIALETTLAATEGLTYAYTAATDPVGTTNVFLIDFETNINVGSTGTYTLAGPRVNTPTAVAAGAHTVTIRGFHVDGIATAIGSSNASGVILWEGMRIEMPDFAVSAGSGTGYGMLIRGSNSVNVGTVTKAGLRFENFQQETDVALEVAAGQSQFSAGSVTNPSISFDLDADKGWFHQAADQVGFSASGASHTAYFVGAASASQPVAGSGIAGGDVAFWSYTGGAQLVPDANGVDGGSLFFRLGNGGGGGPIILGGDIDGGGGGAWSVTTGDGGTGQDDGEGGNAGAITLTTGDGGLGGSGTGDGGNSGSITLVTGAAGTPAGSGATGTVGSILLQPGGISSFTLSSTALAIATPTTVSSTFTVNGTTTIADVSGNVVISGEIVHTPRNRTGLSAGTTGHVHDQATSTLTHTGGGVMAFTALHGGTVTASSGSPTNQGATLYIDGAPADGGGHAIGGFVSYSIFVDAGDVRFDGDLLQDGELAMTHTSTRTIQSQDQDATAVAAGIDLTIAGAAAGGGGTGGRGGDLILTAGAAGGSAANRGGDLVLTPGVATSTARAGAIQMNGGQMHKLRDETATSITLDLDDTLLNSDATSGNVTVNLPAAATAYDSTNDTSAVYTVQKVDSGSNTVTVDPSGAETIGGASTVVLSNQYDSVSFYTDGTEWFTR